MLVNTQNLRALFQGYRTIVMDALQGAAPDLSPWAMITHSTGEEEVYAWLGAVPGMRELVGEIVIRNLSASDFAIKNREFESTVAVKRANIERDTYGVYDPMMRAMGIAAAQHPEELLFEVLLKGFDEKCYTGKNFFDSNHRPKKDGTAFSNVGRKKLSVANFEAARAEFKLRKNAEGRSMKIGRDLVLAVSPKNEALARQIVVADLAPNGGTNVNKGTARLEVRPELAEAEDAWFLFELGQPVKPFIIQNEVETEFNALDNPDSDHVFKRQEFLYQTYRRGNVGFGLPELAYGSDGSQPA